MRIYLYVFSALLPAVIVLALACDGGNESAGPADQATGTPAGAPTEEATPTPGEDSTPAPDGSGPTPTVTGGRPADDITPVPGARIATVPPNLVAFVSEFGGEIPTTIECDYEDERGLVDCTAVGLGLIQLSPPVLEGGVIVCKAFLVGEELTGVTCTGGDPFYTAIYELE